MKHGGGSIMLWGVLLEKGQIDCECQKIYIFLQGNDPKHTSNVVTNWLKDNTMNDLDQSSQSPHLNLIKFVD